MSLFSIRVVPPASVHLLLFYPGTVGSDQSVTRGQLEENCSVVFRDFFEGFVDPPFRFQFIRLTVGKVLLYPLLGESGLGLCCSSVDVGKGSPGDSMAAMLLALGAIITPVGHYQNPYLRLLMMTGSVVLRRMASDSATDKASGLGTRKGNTSLRGSKGG
jgi:hypothetical protein